MKLSTQEAALFFQLMWSLQNYVNTRLEIIPGVNMVEEYAILSSLKKKPVRAALYDNIELVDMYLEENPQDFPVEDLEIIASWKNFRRGKYFIERLLKKYAIFIKNKKVYGVFALYDSFEDVLWNESWPYYAEAVLLPFKGKLIYDGLLLGYRVSLGVGIKSELKEIYMAAKQNGRIIESFDPQIQAEITARKRKPIKGWGPAMAEMSQKVRQLRSSSGAPAIHSPALSITKSSIEFAELAADNPDDIEELRRVLKKIERAIHKAEIVLDRAEYY